MLLEAAGLRGRDREARSICSRLGSAHHGRPQTCHSFWEDLLFSFVKERANML